LKKIGDIPVNDGGGLFDNEGLCDSLILDCNNSVKALASGNYVQFCSVIVQMVQKISNLKNGIKADTDALKSNIVELKRMSDSLAEQITGLPVEKDGESNGIN
jgi:hypothetical protein